jgi:serine/threonine protein kinase
MSGKRGKGERDDDFLEMPAAAFAAPFLGTGDPTEPRSSDGDLRVALEAALGDRYRIEREVGRGGMATVFLARDTKHGRRVAIKVLHADAASALGSDRFVREIETVANLAHPHILPLFDSGRASAPRGGGELLYFAMPYVEGESLRDRLMRNGALPVALALRFAREIADALAYAHRRGIVHRDIKPANVLLTSGGTAAGSADEVHALLADFGIARALARAVEEGSTQGGAGAASGSRKAGAP